LRLSSKALVLVLTTCGALALSSAPLACSDDSCEDDKCAPGNRCLAYRGETRCRKTCTSNTDPVSNCPFGYTCTDTRSGAPPFCLQDEANVTPKPGQWGTPCRANLGVDNPDCDVTQGFFCYGTFPTDANAYCTRYDCTKDSDCGAGFGCETINSTPNVGAARRLAIGAVQKVCRRRTYCSPCEADVDCPTANGIAQRCVPDANGVSFCAPVCTSTTNCPKDAQCVDAGIDVPVCYPRATVCVGDGSLCSPCRADSDCGEDGICIQGEFTTERACAKKARSGCASCPRTIALPRRQIGCSSTGNATVPKEYCFGIYEIDGVLADLGCWTPDR
jgi:hypothetical protein